MPRTRAEPDNVQFTITLPRKAAEKLENLIETGLYGSNRAAVASNLILRRLQDLFESGKVQN